MSCNSKLPTLILEILEFKQSRSLIDQEYFSNNSRNNLLPEIKLSWNRQEHQILLSENEKSHSKNESSKKLKNSKDLRFWVEV